MIALADGRTEAVQTFYSPDGTVARVRHLARIDGDTHETSSFDEDGSGWKPRRTYVWHRETEGGR